MSNTAPTSHRAGRLFAVLCLLFCTASLLLAQSNTVVISQVYGGGGNLNAQYNRDFIELHNISNTPVDVTGWSLQYTSTAGTSWGSQKTILSGVIPAGGFMLIGEQSGSTGAALPADFVPATVFNMSASAGKLALLKSSTSLPTTVCPTSADLVDFVGFGGVNCSEGSTTGATSAPTLSNILAAIRIDACTDTDNNRADFTSAAPAPRNLASPAVPCGSTIHTPPSGIGASNPASVDPGASVLLTVAVTPGQNPASQALTVVADLRSIGGTQTQSFFDDGLNGDAVSGDNIFSLQYTVPVGTADGAKSLPFTVSDNYPSSSTGSIALGVNAPPPPPPPFKNIHEIQGSGRTSPLVGQKLTTQGIVTGRKSNGFYIQNRPTDYDADDNSSEAVFVFTQTAPPSTAQIGNEVSVVATVAEFTASTSTRPLTELTTPTVTLIGTGNALPPAVNLTAADTNPAGPIDALSKCEAMRVHTEKLRSIAGTEASKSEANSTSNSYGSFWAVLGDLSRPFREPGIDINSPLYAQVPAGAEKYDGNPERIRVDTDALSGATRFDVSSNTVLTNVDGILDFTFDAYTIDIEPGTTPTVSGGMQAVPVRDAGQNEFTVASFNMERFYDSVNDPGQDVALTAAAYNLRLTKASKAIRNVLKMPDIVGIAEIEHQSTVDDLASRINSDAVAAGQPNPNYSGYLYEGNDIGGIDVAVLVKGGGRVIVDSVQQIGKDATFIDPADNSVDTLNDRPPLVLKARVVPAKGRPFPITFVVNHLKSFIGSEDTDSNGLRVRAKRAAQAEYLAQLISQYQGQGENVIAVGDYNAYQFNDGLVDVIGTVKGSPAGADSALYPTADYLDPNAVDLLDFVAADERYTYVEDGNAQVLDHIIVTQSLLARNPEVQMARLDADFPDPLRGDATRAERLSDHDVPVAFFTFPPPQADLGVAVAASTATPISGQPFTYTVKVTNAGPDTAEEAAMVAAIGSAASVTNVVAPAGWTCSTTSGVQCTTEALAAGASAEFTITAAPACGTANGTQLLTSVGVTSATSDANAADNQASITATVSNPLPVISGLTINRSMIWPPNHKMTNIALSYAISDNCDAVITPVITVSSNQPLNGVGDGNTDVDWQIVGDKLVQLRAERSGESVRVYTITVSATDSAGGSASQSIDVQVANQ